MECSEYQAVQMGVQVEEFIVCDKQYFLVCMEEGPFCNRHFFVKPYRKFVMKYLFIVKDSAVIL